MPKNELKKAGSLPWPESALAHDPVALTNFAQLCVDCDREELQLCLSRIVAPETFRRRDSWAEATAGLDLTQIKRIAAQARRFEASLNKVRGTVLAMHLRAAGFIPNGDLLHPANGLRSLACIRRLDELVQESGFRPQATPDLHEDIEHLVRIVKRGCRQYHYPKLEQILRALGRPILSIKQFRADHRKRLAAAGKGKRL